MPNSTGKYAMNSRLYDILKDTALIYLPALGTLYVTLATIWGLPSGEQVAATALGLSTFLGVCLKISKTSYDNSDKSTDAYLYVDGDGVKRFETKKTTDEVAQMKSLNVEVKREPDLPLS